MTPLATIDHGFATASDPVLCARSAGRVGEHEVAGEGLERGDQKIRKLETREGRRKSEKAGGRRKHRPEKEGGQRGWLFTPVLKMDVGSFGPFPIFDLFIPQS